MQNKGVLVNLVFCALLGSCVSYKQHEDLKFTEFLPCEPLNAQEELTLTIKEDYKNKLIQPSAPLPLQSTFVIHEILKVDELNQDVLLQLTMFQRWHDRRLELMLPPCPDNMTIPLPQDLHSEIWLPTTRVTNSISATISQAPAVVKIITCNPKGDVEFRVNMNLVIPCKADYVDFPFDTITCTMVIGTWLPGNYINMTWIDELPVKVLSGRIKLASYAVGKTGFVDASTPIVGGRWFVSFHLHRYFNYYIFNVYIPNALVVILAWASFWFIPDGGRGGLCLTCLVSIILQFNGVANSIPKVGYTKGIDIWFLGCLVLICTTFLEYSFLAYMQRQAGGLDEPMPMKRFKKYTIRDFSTLVDRIFRVIFMLAFIALVVAYFGTYGKAPPKTLGEKEGDNK